MTELNPNQSESKRADKPFAHAQMAQPNLLRSQFDYGMCCD